MVLRTYNFCKGGRGTVYTFPAKRTASLINHCKTIYVGRFFFHNHILIFPAVISINRLISSICTHHTIWNTIHYLECIVWKSFLNLPILRPCPIHFLQVQSISYFVKFEIRKRMYATNVILLVFRTLRHSVRADGARTRLGVRVLCDTRVDNRNDGRGNVTVPWNGHRWPTFKGTRAIIVIRVGWQSISSTASDVCVRSGSAEMIKYTFMTSRRYCFGDCGGNNPGLKQSLVNVYFLIIF